MHTTHYKRADSFLVIFVNILRQVMTRVRKLVRKIGHFLDQVII